jgi:AraC-like DNA-binding protein
LAHGYLKDRHVPLQQIAWRLGYSEIGAFNHAFKRWTGTSPGRARKLSHNPLSLTTLGSTSNFSSAVHASCRCDAQARSCVHGLEAA